MNQFYNFLFFVRTYHKKLLHHLNLFYKFQLFAQDFDGVYAIVMIMLWVDSKLVKKSGNRSCSPKG